MKIYLVGGAVRDQLLGLKVKDNDYLVVGATPEQLLAQGYQSVGKDFPVFLHPKTKQEYALARTERKQGQGYTGFACYFAPDVTLEQDLMRRDLTINAMALDEQSGELFDPYGGRPTFRPKYCAMCHRPLLKIHCGCLGSRVFMPVFIRLVLLWLTILNS